MCELSPLISYVTLASKVMGSPCIHTSNCPATFSGLTLKTLAIVGFLVKFGKIFPPQADLSTFDLRKPVISSLGSKKIHAVPVATVAKVLETLGAILSC